VVKVGSRKRKRREGKIDKEGSRMRTIKGAEIGQSREQKRGNEGREKWTK
jgi:hypothetical protein